MDGAWRGEAKRGGAGAAGCEDGEEGGEAARSGTITEQAASVVALHCVAAGYVGSGDGGESFVRYSDKIVGGRLPRRRHPTKAAQVCRIHLLGTLVTIYFHRI